MPERISVIIPNRNGSATIGACLDAVFASEYAAFEVIVVDDCSTDNSVEIARDYPCRLVELSRHCGAGRARNAGARRAAGDVLFFIDSDCVVRPDTLAKAGEAVTSLAGEYAAVGGTYTRIPYDVVFFSLFQSVFVNYFEMKRGDAPDYIATHALAMRRTHFLRSGGFDEEFLPMLEDVEFSHRLRADGCRLAMSPDILVRHIFNFSLITSLKNAMRKSMYWTTYSVGHGDLLADSGTASVVLKVNGAAFILCTVLAMLAAITGSFSALLPIAGLCGANYYLNRGLFAAFYRSGGCAFSIRATLYYLLLYPLPIVAGALIGLAAYAMAARANTTPGHELGVVRKEYC